MQQNKIIILIHINFNILYIDNILNMILDIIKLLNIYLFLFILYINMQKHL